MNVLIIAEAGVNHNADIDMAFKLIDAAVVVQADVIKFQAAVPHEVVTRHARKADYQLETTDPDESQLEMTKRIHLDLSAFDELQAYAARKNIKFLVTSFGPISTAYLSKLKLGWWKIPSGEITNLSLLRRVGEHCEPVILSTGMATLGEIEDALEVLECAGTNRSQVTVLHCNTEYPTPMRDVNLRAMLSIRDALGVRVGYSDHTAGIEVPIAAVALGATVIEKHLTLDRNLLGPDHKASLEPDEFAAMVRAIRNIEQAMGDGIKRPSPSEAKNKPIARKSLVAAKPIKAGERFTSENLAVKRPGTGISPMRWDEVMGGTATRDYGVDELIEL